ncbi:hypothetical protein [Flagellimonas sp. S3867]|uniref:hypothetical protein n=1 Tax=Flagellimonas sp. S3867 TaxID=2768063 RepID=UPI001CC23F23|nr:hypothetical protein [Flagellimonas sp. S3867]
MTITILMVLYSNSYGQQLDGVWMSYNNRIVDKNEQYTSGQEGLILDFTNNTFGHLSSDSVLRFKRRNNKLRIRGLGKRISIKAFQNDSIEFPPSGNVISVFHKLELKVSFDIKEKEIIKFLTNNKFDSLYGLLDVEFSSDQFWLDKMFGKKEGRFNLINNTWKDNDGYWYLKNVHDVYFLIFAPGQIEEKHIFQILDMDEKRMKLKPLQDSMFGPDQLTELRPQY